MYLRMLVWKCVSVIKPSVFDNWHLLKLGFCLAASLKPGGRILYVLITFQSDGSQFSEKDILCCKIGKSLGDLHLKWTNKLIYKCKFSKITALRKRRSEACSQGKDCLMSSQAKETRRPSWSMYMYITIT